MPRDFPTVKPGDPIQAWWFRAIFDELGRWRKAMAAPPLCLDYADSATAAPQFHLGPVSSLIGVEVPGTGCPAAANYSTPATCTVKVLAPQAAGGFVAGSGSTPTATMLSTFKTKIGGDGTPRFAWAAYVNGYLMLVDGDC